LKPTSARVDASGFFGCFKPSRARAAPRLESLAA
jgi:hypothetical protein